MKKVMLLIGMMFMSNILFGQSKVEVSAGADIVSSYVWRGAYQGQGAAFQPRASVSYLGFTLGTWGSTPFGDFKSGKEVDFSLSYEVAGFQFMLTDYWWEGEGKPYFDMNGHYIEAALAYTVSERIPLSIAVSTMLNKSDDWDEDGKTDFSTYIHASYPFNVRSYDFTVGLGFSPLDGLYVADGESHIVDTSLRVAKELVITEKIALPLFSEVIFSPAKDNAYIVFGLSLTI